MRALVLVMATLITGSGQPLPKQPGDYTPAAQSNTVTWNLKRVPPPSPLYLTVDDVLRAHTVTNQPNEVVTVNYRWLRAADSSIQYGQFTLRPQQFLGSGATLDEPLAEGFLLSASCQAAVAQQRGQTFVRLFVNPKVLGSGAPAYMLMADYCTTNTAPGFPNGRVVDPTEGPGWVHTVQFNNPGHGHDWGDTTNVNGQRRLIGLSAVLATSAVAGNRTPQFIILDNVGHVIFQLTANTLQGVNSAAFYNWSPAPLFTTPNSSSLQVPLPPALILPPSSSAEVVTLGLDTNTSTGDNWTQIFETIEEWLINV